MCSREESELTTLGWCGRAVWLSFPRLPASSEPATSTIVKRICWRAISLAGVVYADFTIATLDSLIE